MDLEKFFTDFQDHLVPELDVYEQAIYLYLFRHTCLLGLEEDVFPLKSHVSRKALGLGKAGGPMSENSAKKKLESLESKHCIEILEITHKGRRIRVKLPSEIIEIENDNE